MAMGRPTLTALSLFAAVFGLQTIGVVGIGTGAYALAIPLGNRLWTIHNTKG